MLPDILPDIPAWETLADMRVSTSDGSVAGMQIEARMVEVFTSALSAANSWDGLLLLWTTCPRSTVLEGIIEEKAWKILMTIEDWRELMGMWFKSRDTYMKARYLIENRLAEIMQTISDWDELVKVRTQTPSFSSPRKIVMERMVSVLPDLLSTINDWDKLSGIWSVSAEFGNWNRLRLQIEEKMEQLIATVDAHSCPKWFIDLVRDPGSCPVRAALDQKVAELKKELNITD